MPADKKLPGQLKTARVQKSISELRAQLEEAVTLAQEIRRSGKVEITRVTPGDAPNTREVELTIYGANFAPDATCALDRPDLHVHLKGSARVVTGTNTIHATFDLTGQNPGAWDVVVETGHEESARLPAAFIVTAKAGPEITRDPSFAPEDGRDKERPWDRIAMTLQGTGFDDPTVQIVAGDTQATCRILNWDNTEIKSAFNPHFARAALEEGAVPWLAIVKNKDGQKTQREFPADLIKKVVEVLDAVDRKKVGA